MCCTQYSSKFGKLSSGHKTGKGQFSIQSQRKARPTMFKVPHNCTHITHPDDQAEFRKGRGSRFEFTNICLIMEKAREFQENIFFCFIDYSKAFNCITTNWKILNEMKTPDNLTCLLWNLNVGQEGIVRTVHGTMEWFQTERNMSRLYIVTLFI